MLFLKFRENPSIFGIRLTDDVKIIVAIKNSPCYNRQETIGGYAFAYPPNPTTNTTETRTLCSHMDKFIEKVSAYGPSYCVDLHDLVQPAIRRWSARSSATVGCKMERFDSLLFAGGIGWKKTRQTVARSDICTLKWLTNWMCAAQNSRSRRAIQWRSERDLNPRALFRRLLP